jgi:hypothetical protein
MDNKGNINEKNNTINGLDNIKKMYNNLTYFDQYGLSVILFIIITLALIIFMASCIALINARQIQQDWTNQRCKPYIIPIAGFINKPPNMSFSEYTSQNFNYCTQNILKNISGFAVEPITFATKNVNNVVNSIKDSINSIRGITDKIRTFFGNISEEIMGRLLNIMIPLQQIIITFKDFIAKIQGTMTAGLFTTLGAYFTLKSLMGVIVKFIVTILIALAAMIAIFWIFPFTWGTAITSTAIFVAISIPFAILLTFMTNVLGVNPGVSMPRIKCFDKNTMFTMKDGINKTIRELQVGEKLKDNSLITAKIIVDTKGSKMYNLNGVIVSDTHIVKYNNKWIHVDEHPYSKRIDDYSEPYLYCINTDNKVISLNALIFSDWDEIYDEDLEKIKNLKIKNVKYNYNIGINYDINEVTNLDIHKYLDGGFNENTKIDLKNGIVKKIKHISIGDVLCNGEKVYGIVEIDGQNIIEQAIYNLGKNKYIEGGANINLCDKNIKLTSTLDLYSNNKLKKIKNIDEMDNKLYHLLTDKKLFSINGIQFYDYNSCIDLFLEKYRGKLLSMKYV